MGKIILPEDKLLSSGRIVEVNQDDPAVLFQDISNVGGRQEYQISFIEEPENSSGKAEAHVQLGPAE